jgi:hypothetical protein
MLSRFALTIWRASTDAFSYVADFAKRTAGSGLGYLYALRVTLAFFGLLPFAIGLAVVAPHAGTFARDQLATLRDWYPDDLVLTVTGGVLSTNAEEPVVLDLPAAWAGMDDGDTHAVVIDTSASIDDFDAYATRVLLTRTAAVVRDDNALRVIEYTESSPPPRAAACAMASSTGSASSASPTPPCSRSRSR